MAQTNPFPWHHWAQQSPIELYKDRSFYVPLPKSYLQINYRDAPFEGKFEEVNGHDDFILAKPHSGSHPPVITLGGVRAELAKIHLHTPSEHDLNGVDLEGEVHLVHKIQNPQQGSEFIVLGCVFNTKNKPAAGSFFKTWGRLCQEGAGGSKGESVSLDPRLLLPKTQKWYRYEGSLTTHPYSELVSWVVFAEPLGISTADLALLKHAAHQEERPTQDLNRRFVLRNFK